MIRFIKRPWGRMAYCDTGGADMPLVLLHGTYCDARDWSAMIAELPSGTRVVNFEFPGHGRSDTPSAPFTIDDLVDDTLALLAHLDCDRVVLAGHSLGGMVAILAADVSPRVAGLVLLEGWTDQRACAAYIGTRTYGRLDAATIGSIDRKKNEYHARCPVIWTAFAESAASFDGFAILARMTIPVYEVYGSFGKTEHTEVALHIPDNPAIRTRWIPDAGHYLPHEKPAETAAICAQALAKAETSIYKIPNLKRKMGDMNERL